MMGAASSVNTQLQNKVAPRLVPVWDHAHRGQLAGCQVKVMAERRSEFVKFVVRALITLVPGSVEEEEQQSFSALNFMKHRLRAQPPHNGAGSCLARVPV